MTDLKDLIVDIKSAKVPFPGIEGFEVEIANISRPELASLRKSCMVTKFDRKYKRPMEELDEDKYIRRFTEKTVLGWSGLTLDKLQSLLVIKADASKLQTELKYSADNAEMLVKHSSEFDDWLTEAVFDLDHFRDQGEGAAVEKPGKVAE